MENNNIIESLLNILSVANTEINSEIIAKDLNIDHQVIISIVNSLAAREILQFKLSEKQKWILTDEGKEIVIEGSHEAKVYNNIPPNESIYQDVLINILGKSAKIGIGKAIKSNWIEINSNKMISRKVTSIVDEIQNQLIEIEQNPTNPSLDKNILKELSKRKLINNQILKTYIISKGSHFSTKIIKVVTDLTTDMINSESWKNETFKKYNFDTNGTIINSGHLHPLLKVREEFRNIFFEMGFTEMPTNNFVESSFWNFDALFQPQQHPARDAHDTFFIKDPYATTVFPDKYLENVKDVHTFSYCYNWKEEEAMKNIMRTHTTAVSARMLYKLAQSKFEPVKYFSIDRVFRNETLDDTHLAEFHQIEGVIADYDLSLGDLIGIIELFFKKIGMNKLRFKPAYNPYTEPSMEIFGYHEGLKRWIELGNSGIFRPEMLLPMGFPENVTVIAWGLSLERPTMIKYGYNNIRSLCGSRINLEMVKNNPICRLDKN